MNELLQSIYDTSIGTAMREGASAFPWTETIHVIALTTVFGTIAIVDMRLLGYPSHRRGVRLLIKEMLPFTWVAFVVAVVTGLLLFTSNAVDYAANTAFRVKMLLLVLAGVNMAIFHATAYRRITEWDDARRPPVAARIAGASSLGLWLQVIIFGRWIGFTI